MRLREISCLGHGSRGASTPLRHWLGKYIMKPSVEEFIVTGGKGDPSVVLLPGWATDGRVFDGLFPGVATITTGVLRPEGFTRRLSSFLDRSAPAPVAIVGWSLGGFLAAAFAREYPEKVRRVVLVGIRRGYPEGAVEAVSRSLSADRNGCLSAFYAQCFYPSQMTAYRRFRAGLQASYLRELDGGALRDGLSYLAGAGLSAGTLPTCPVAIVHGEKDVVAPLAEAESVARGCGNASFHPLAGAAHAAFLAEDFRAVAADGHGRPSAAGGRDAPGSVPATDG